MITPFDSLSQWYASRRYPLFARSGMVSCSVPQASAAGLEILRNGGNAMAAAVAAAAALTVTEPTSNGLGSDAFALIWSEKEQKLFGLNASGPAPMLISRAAGRRKPGTDDRAPGKRRTGGRDGIPDRQQYRLLVRIRQNTAERESAFLPDKQAET